MSDERLLLQRFCDVGERLSLEYCSQYIIHLLKNHSSHTNRVVEGSEIYVMNWTRI